MFLEQEAGLGGRFYVSLDDFAQLEAARRDPDALPDARGGAVGSEEWQRPSMAVVQ